jgi:hypothetical protein
MNKIYKTAFILLCILGDVQISSSQITITGADMPHIGDGLVIVTDQTPTIAPGGSGAGQTWNFSTLKSSSVDTEYMQNPAALFNAGTFPTATVAITNSQYTLYCTVGSTAYTQVGLVWFLQPPPNQVWQYRNPDNELYPLPCSYQSKWRQKYQYWNKGPMVYNNYDSVMNLISVTSLDSIDAWGSLTTPAGTYNTLRDYEQAVAIDSNFMHSKTINKWVYQSSSKTVSKTYSWLANGIHDNVVSISADSTGKPSSVTWVKTVMPNAVNEIPKSVNELPYPNPSSTELTLKINSPLSKYLRIMDATGREVETLRIETDLLLVNTTAYGNGLYFYQIIDNAAKVLGTGKFVVVQ